MKTKCLVVDNEPLARELICSHIHKIENLEMLARCGDTNQGLQILQEMPVDLMFLDTQLPDKSGIDFLQSLNHPPEVILMSATREFALEGFEMDVVDYLLKPIKFDRFKRAIDKYQLLKGISRTGFYSAIPCIWIKENKKIVKLPLVEILYVEGLGEYVRIHTTKRNVVTKMGIGEMEEKLIGYSFLRIHKSYIVSVPKIDAYSGNVLEINNIKLPIGRSFKTEVLKNLTFPGSIVLS